MMQPAGKHLEHAHDLAALRADVVLLRCGLRVALVVGHAEWREHAGAKALRAERAANQVAAFGNLSFGCGSDYQRKRRDRPGDEVPEYQSNGISLITTHD